jgi:hypothetical protein
MARAMVSVVPPAGAPTKILMGPDKDPDVGCAKSEPVRVIKRIEHTMPKTFKSFLLITGGVTFKSFMSLFIEVFELNALNLKMNFDFWLSSEVRHPLPCGAAQTLVAHLALEANSSNTQISLAHGIAL